MIGIVAETDVPVSVRDGLRLSANIWRPDRPGTYPVIMAFTAFSKDGLWSPTNIGWGLADECYSPTVTGTTVFEAEDPAFWVRHKYVIAVVDPRGFYRSPGTRSKAEVDGVVGEQGVTRLGLWARDMYDAIEWAGTQEWSNGNVGLSGVSILAFSQWRVAAMSPPHLKAFVPWEGMTDYHRDVMFRGGIEDTEWVRMIGANRPQLTEAWPGPEHEDVPAPMDRPEDDFLADITTPALICASWSNHGNHTRGSFRAYRKISSKDKWLYTHGRQEWGEYYNTEAQAIRKLFFDHYLQGFDSRIFDIPRVRLETREDARRYTVRYENEFPLPQTEYRPLYLDAADGSLKLEKSSRKDKAEYDSAEGKAVFDYTFPEDTELTGYMKLKLWVSPEDAGDMDLFVTLRKFGEDGKEIYFDAFYLREKYPVAFGWLRLSHRELDKEKSTAWEPYPVEVAGPGEGVAPGEIVSCEIPILPASTLFRKGETLRVLVSGIYGAGEITNVPMGFNASVNKGRHALYTGGEYDSHLLVPVIAAKSMV